MKQAIKNLIKNDNAIMNFISSVYNIIHYNNAWKYQINNIFKYNGAFLKKTRFHIKGSHNEIILGSKTRLRNCKFTIIGNDCKVIIGGGHTIISNVHFWCQDDNSTIIIGNDFTMEGGHLASTEGKTIRIGNDCMFSENIEIRNGDSHSILDCNSNKRINHAKDVFICNHVWIAAHVRILKGSYIPSNSVIGNSSVVSSVFDKENCIYAGTPCRFIKGGINWDRYKL